MHSTVCVYMMLNAIICWPYGCIRSQKKDGQYIIKGAGREDERRTEQHTPDIMCADIPLLLRHPMWSHRKRTKDGRSSSSSRLVVTILRDFSWQYNKKTARYPDTTSLERWRPIYAVTMKPPPSFRPSHISRVRGPNTNNNPAAVRLLFHPRRKYSPDPIIISKAYYISLYNVI